MLHRIWSTRFKIRLYNAMQHQNTPLQRNAALKINEVFRGKLDQELGYESLKDRR